MLLWKSRLPAIVVPVLAGLRSLPLRELREGLPPGCQPLEIGLLVAIAGVTGYAKLPFSVTWWIVLLAAFALQTELLLGATVCLSLTVVLGWYGTRSCHPQAVSALWGGSRRQAPGPWARAAWHAWDLFVHGLPAALVLWWHGPSPGSPGTATPLAVAATLPMNVLWLWGLGLSLSREEGAKLRLWPFSMSLSETNAVYQVAPELPWQAWRWIYGSHWAACGLWLAYLLLPPQGLLAVAIFVVHGAAGIPYTNAWWSTFLVCLYGRGDYAFLEGVCACCALTTAVGFYATQILVPHAFMSLVRAWVVVPVQKYGPRWFSRAVTAASRHPAFAVAAHLGDLFLHLIPTSVATYMYWNSITSGTVLLALPTNLIYWAATGSKTLAETNRIYGVSPPLSSRMWHFVYGSHWVLCLLLLLACLVAEHRSGLLR